MTVNIRLHAVQAAFRACPARFRAFVGGRGAGKSWIGTYDLIRRPKPRRLYTVAAPTYTMLRDATLRSFLDHVRRLHYLLDWKQTDHCAVLGNGAEVLFRSADDPERLRGPNISGLLFDEAGGIAKEAWDIGIGCLREGGEAGWAAATTTPKGKANWTWAVFAQDTADARLFRAKTQDNPFNPPDFADTLRRQYTSAFARQEIDAEFLDAGGLLAKREWFPILPAAPACSRHVRAWDFAATEKAVAGTDPDYTAGVLWGDRGGGRWAILDVVRARVQDVTLETLLKTTTAADASRHGNVSTVLEQEPGSAGANYARYLLRVLTGYVAHAQPSTGDKVQRAMPMLAQAEAGNIALAPGRWNTPFLDEVSAFPEGEHDDQVDAAGLGFSRIASAGGSRILI